MSFSHFLSLIACVINFVVSFISCEFSISDVAYKFFKSSKFISSSSSSFSTPSSGIVWSSSILSTSSSSVSSSSVSLDTTLSDLAPPIIFFTSSIFNNFFLVSPCVLKLISLFCATFLILLNNTCLL